MVCSAILLILVAPPIMAADNSNVVVLSEAGLPVGDSGTISRQELNGVFAGAQLSSVDQVRDLLKEKQVGLLVLPYGSSFPQDLWPDVYEFLQRGGNLLVVGGRPFTRAAYRDASGWHLRDYSVRFTRPLGIDQYQVTPGSDGLEFQTNPDVPVQLPRFAWKQAFSPIIRLSTVDLYKRGGAAGSIDARLDALAWGTGKGHKLSAPAIEVDHIRNGFDGGRWVFLNADLPSGFLASTDGANLIHALAERARGGAEDFSARPVLPLYLPGEPLQIEIEWYAARAAIAPLTATIRVYPEGQDSHATTATVDIPTSHPVNLAAPTGRGLYIVHAELHEGNKTRASYHSAFWIRDDAYLHSGPRLSVNRDYFEINGAPIAVIGTTYMSSEVQRLYFDHPNVYVWNRDLAQIHEAGLNMIRTGWWTGWDKFCDENGQPYERTLRTLEAYLMTARKYDLPVQFNFFAFLPDVLGGVNAFIDPEAVRRQQTLIAAVVARFRDVPFLAWDLINEPSISQHLWTTRPNGDPLELAAWNEWLNKRYPDSIALAAAWNLPVAAAEKPVPLPDDLAFTPRGMYVGHNSLKIYDFHLFAQDVFSGWVDIMRNAIRKTGSAQLITVGQDEGGIQDRLSPAFWGRLVDFATNHSWWQNDYILWDSLMAKQPGQAMLIQETGLQRELTLDEIARRSPENEAALLERKIAMSFVHGAGAIEWLWNTNSYMTESNETPIGAVLADGTEKPEAFVLARYAAFARDLQGRLRDPQQASIAIVTSQAAQFSVIAGFQLEAQRKAVRALAYFDRLACYGIAENQLEKLGSPRLAILPSPQSLSQAGWQALLTYVKQGGNLLVTGPVNRDEHWHFVDRSADLQLQAQTEPLTYHRASIDIGTRAIPLSYSQDAQNWLESLRFRDGATLKQISYGKGQIFLTPYPVELAEGAQAAADLYSYVAGRLSLTPAFDLQSPLSPGIMLYPVLLQDGVLYIMTSDNDVDSRIDLRDKATGVRLTIPLQSQRAALALIGRREKKVIAKYGF